MQKRLPLKKFTILFKSFILEKRNFPFETEVSHSRCVEESNETSNDYIMWTIAAILLHVLNPALKSGPVHH